MITIPEVEQLAFQGSSPKNLTLQFPFSTLTNENIFMESAQLEQSVCEESNLTFGMVYSSCFSVTIFDDGVSRLGQRVIPVLSVDDGNGGTYTRSLGRYVVKSDKRTSDKLYRELKCYDFLTEILSTDFSAWHNSMPNHCKIKKYRNDFFTHIGIAQESITLPNDEVTVPRYKATELTGADVLAGILQVNGAFGFMATNGKFKYVLPKTTHDYLIDDNSFVQGSLVYEDEPIRPITGVTMKGFSDDYGDDDSFSRAEISVGNANGAVYTIEDNNFVHAIYESQRKDICNNLLALLNGYTYYPTNVEVPAYIGLEPGDVFKIETSDKDIYFPVLKRTLKGISALQDELAAEGESDSDTAGSVSSGVSSAQLAINQVRDSVAELLAQKASIEAQDAAISANNSANSALTQLSIVEDVAGTLKWISENGEFVVTSDTAVKPGTVYFIYENGEYVPIANPDPSANPSTEGWYILDVTESQSKYIMSHLAVTSAGLWVLPVDQIVPNMLTDSSGNQLVDSDGNELIDYSTENPQYATGYKVLLSGTGMSVFNDEGAMVANYGTTTTIGEASGYNVHITNSDLQIRDSETVLARYGTISTIGEEDGTKIQIAPEFMSATNENGYEFFGLHVNQDSVITTKYIYNNIWSANVQQYQGGTASFTIILPFLPIEAEFDLSLRIYHGNFYQASFSPLTKGTAQVETVVSQGSYSNSYTINYDGDNSLTLTGDVITGDDRWTLFCDAPITLKAPSFTFGLRRDDVRGDFSATIGQGLTASYSNQVVIGKYNDNNSNNAFEIGNGFTIGNPKNALTVDWNGNLVCGSMDSGRYENVSVSANSYADFSVSFNKTFTSAPIVTASFWSTSTASEMGYLSLAVHTITTTGFQVRVFNKDSSTRAPYINWIALLT